MFPEVKVFKIMLIVLAVFIPAYLWLAGAFFADGDSAMGLLCLAWAGFLVLACRWGRCVLRCRKDDDDE